MNKGGRSLKIDSGEVQGGQKDLGSAAGDPTFAPYLPLSILQLHELLND